MFGLNRLKKRQITPQRDDNVISEKKLLLGIAASISYNDHVILSEMETCIWNTKQYFKEHCEHYEARGIMNANDVKKIRWFTLIDLLVHYGYICEFNWKCGKEGFVYFLEKIPFIQSEELSIEKEWLRDDGDMIEWCKTLEEKWKVWEISIAVIESSNESYALFPVFKKEIKYLEMQANLLGYRIHGC